jgi:hypothetical protein
MASIMLSESALEKLAAVQEILAAGDETFNLDATLEYIVDRWHNAYLGGNLPDGWELNNDISSADLAVYSEVYNGEEYLKRIAAKRKALDLGKEDHVLLDDWTERLRVVRAALLAGWIVKPVDLSLEDIDNLSPAKIKVVKNALDRHYYKLVMADPNL